MTSLELDALYFSPGKWHGANDGEKLSGRHPPSVIQAVITGALITGSEISCIWRQAGYVSYCMLLCRQVLWNGSEINRFSFLPDGLFHNTITCITCGIVDDNLHDNSSTSKRHRWAKSLVLNIVSVKLVDPELGITYTGIVYILGVTIWSHVRSKDLTSPDTTQSLIMTSLNTEQVSSKYTDTWVNLLDFWSRTFLR